jgi:HK97 family phage prohead protease
MSLLPADLLVSPVKGHDDLIQFQLDFTLAGKALEDGTAGQTLTVEDNGDLIIEGMAAVWEGDDRQGENFAPGAFQRGIKGFLEGQSALCYHHKHDKLLGKVLALEETDEGLKMRARVDGAIKDDPSLKTIYAQIKSGSLNALSCGGFFKRAMVAGKQKITDMDFTEISVTPVPVHSRTSFGVIAGKALESAADPVDAPDVLSEEVPDDLIQRLTAVFAKFDSLGAKALPEGNDSEAASTLANLLNDVQKLRQTATSITNFTDNEEIKSHADAIESSLSAHEAELHTLAAQIGPLPPTYSY